MKLICDPAFTNQTALKSLPYYTFLSSSLDLETDAKAEGPEQFPAECCKVGGNNIE